MMEKLKKRSKSRNKREEEANLYIEQGIRI